MDDCIYGKLVGTTALPLFLVGGGVRRMDFGFSGVGGGKKTSASRFAMRKSPNKKGRA